MHISISKCITSLSQIPTLNLFNTILSLVGYMGHNLNWWENNTKFFAVYHPFLKIFQLRSTIVVPKPTSPLKLENVNAINIHLCVKGASHAHDPF